MTQNLASREQLPFRNFERAHQRVRQAEQALASAVQEREQAFAQLAELGYQIEARPVVDPDAPPLPDRFDAEREQWSVRV